MASGNTTSPSLMVPAAGVAVGVLVFWGLNFWFHTPIIPTLDDVIAHNPMGNVTRPTAAAAAEETAELGPYQRVCQACHQADGKGMTGAFPPLAGSEWLTQDPETPIRIVLMGLSGPIEVAGTQWNAAMPPPPAMSDADIAEAITFARKNFGNDASEVTEAMVAEVRTSLGGRANPWTSAELAALRPAAGEAAAAPDGGAAPAEAGDAVPPTGEEAAAPGQAPEEAAKAAAPAEGAAAAPAAQPTAAPAEAEAAAPAAQPAPAGPGTETTE